MSSERTVGLVLAGGAGSRLGDRDKAWLPLAGRPLICHALERLRPQVDRVLVSANRHRWAYRRLGLDSVADRDPWRGRGPLAAIATVLQHSPDSRLAVVPVDVPFAPVDQVAALSARLDAGAAAAALTADGRRQPLFALLAPTLAAAAIRGLAGNPVPSMRAWLEQCGVAWVTYAGDPRHFLNINRIADLAEAERQTCRPD